jgi:hypothetical protein
MAKAHDVSRPLDADLTEMQRALSLLHRPGTIVELRILDSGRAAAVLDPATRGKLKPLVKRILVSIGHTFVGAPSMRALVTWAISRLGLCDA